MLTRYFCSCTPLGCKSLRALLAITAALACITSSSWAAYTVNTNGTVSDSATGLVWDQCTLGQSGAGCANGSPTRYTWHDALAEVTVRNNANHLGFNDWRLPNIKELESLVDFIVPAAPLYDIAAFPGNANSSRWQYWSSTTDLNSVNALLIDFTNGVIAPSYKPASVAVPVVRLVRGGSAHASFDLLGGYINAVCGSAHHEGTNPLTTVAPTTNLCASGLTGRVITSASQYTWECNGANGGATANCRTARGYFLAASAGANGSIDFGHSPIKAYQETPTLAALPNIGYAVRTWGGTCGGTASGPSDGNFTTDPITANCTVTVSFSLGASHAVTGSANPLGSGSVTCTPNPVIYGANADCTQTPNAGYTFTGWSGACSGTGFCALTNVIADQTVTANYSLNTYSITRVSNPVGAGSIACNPDPVNHGGSTSCSQTPNAGYTFTNWSGACSGNGACAPSNVTANLTITANYTLNTYAVTSTASPTQGGSVVCTPNPVTHGASSNCSHTPNAGYTFTGWSGACSGTGACSLTNVTASQTVTANYSVNTYSILKQSNPLAGGTVTCTPDPVNHGASTSCTQTPNAGYTFANWSGACSGNGACVPSNVTANLTVTANYNITTYAIAASASPALGGSVICTPNPVNHGTSSNCSQTPNAGYSFTGWSGACTGNGACSLTNVTANQSVTASYSLNSYSILKQSNPIAGGAVTCTPDPVNHGATTSCTQAPNAGYTFTNWSGACSGNGACAPSNVTANLTVTATYSLNSYTITRVVSPVAGGSVTCTPNPVSHGSSSTCSQAPNAGYTFTGWSGACTGNGACSLTNVTANQTVTASYSLNTYTVTSSANPAAGGSMSCVPTTVNYNSTSTCTAAPNLGYILGVWGGTCTGTGSGVGNMTYTTNPVTADCSVSVTFTPLPILNIDNSGAPTVYDGATDGLLLMRYLMGLRGAELVQDALGTSPQRDATQIEAHIQTYLTLFDVDGDGAVHPHTDGLLIYRRMLGLSGTALTHGANNGTRTDSQIAAAIDALKP